MPDAPTFLAPESMIVMRRNTVATFEGFFTVPVVEVAEFMIDQMLKVNAKLESDGADHSLTCWTAASRA